MVRVVQDMLGILQKEIFIRKIKKINYNIDTHEILRFASEIKMGILPNEITFILLHDVTVPKSQRQILLSV
jgi:hypothetical protein